MRSSRELGNLALVIPQASQCDAVRETVRNDAEEVGRYLLPTTLCDFEHPMLMGIAKFLTGALLGEKDKAIPLFNHVRDHVLFGSGRLRRKASDTYISEIGGSLVKAKVLAALSRAVLIPTRLHCVLMRKETFKHLIARSVYGRMPREMAHGWPESFLGGRWRACEATLENGLYQTTLRWGYLSGNEVPVIDWDGATDLILFRKWITRDIGRFDSLDQVLQVLRPRRMGGGA